MRGAVRSAGVRVAWVRLAVVCVLAVALSAFGFSAFGCRGSSSGEAAAGAGAEGGRVGSKVADFQLTSLDGQTLTPASLKGKVEIVDFWDTWCGPCLRALPHLKELSLNHPSDVVVVAIALGQEGEGKVREVVARQGLPFPIVLFEAQGDLTPAFGVVDQLPTTFLLGPDGVIRHRWVGSQSLSTYENAAKALLPM